MLNREDVRLINEGRVDSRVREIAGFPVATHPTLMYQRTYCVFCGRPKGYVSQESFEFIAATNIIVICDDCVENLGEPGLPEAHIKEYR